MEQVGKVYELRREPHGGSRRPTAIDLFSGAGGLTLGLLNAGFDVVLSSDWSVPCARTHRKNFPQVPFRPADIGKVAGEEILAQTGLKKGDLDLLIGGPPCQGFSILGQRLLDDPRNQLFGDFIRITGELLPRVAVIENVPGLATLAGGVLLQEIGHAFDALGYDVECAELLAAQYGVPQMRWRMFFVAWRRDQGVGRCGFPLPTHGKLAIGDLVPNRTVRSDQLEGFVSIREAIGDLPPIRSGEECVRYEGRPGSPYQAAMRDGCETELYNHYAAKLAPQNIERIRSLKPGQDWRDLPAELLPMGMRRALRKDHTRRFRRMRWDGVARSIITRFRDPKSGEYTHPFQDRTISIREAARIQSFPDWFIFEGTLSDQYDQVGNAVPPLLAKAVGVQILRALNGERNARSVKSRYRIYA
jgi:DNA (cytosine-5)-methyltransferase 1